jgi:acetamidase/formamidase
MKSLIGHGDCWHDAQIYLLLSCCPCEGRVSGIVDVPNACCTLAIPTAIFDQARESPLARMQHAP